MAGYENDKLNIEETTIAEINPYYFRATKRTKKRINIFLPSINPEHVFGGISTAIRFYEEMATRLGYDKRIILVDAKPAPEAISIYEPEYTFVEAKDDCEEAAQILSYSDRKPYGIPVSERDYFIFTGWWTAHCAGAAFTVWEKENGINVNPFIYFIQDYEPGFYPWSSHYLLAEATYKVKRKQIAIFNTKLLQEYFNNNGYHFFKEYAFEPVLNSSLKEVLYSLPESITKKKQILIYGRPSTKRNAFLLIVEALKQWVYLQSGIEEWRIISAGEEHEPIELGKGVMLESLGKLSLAEYGKVLQESYAGISLMASPHPSYPPLEMSVFGVKVITNTFANKDLKNFNDHIVSLEVSNPENIAHTLEAICDDYKPVSEFVIGNKEYCENEDVFGFIADIETVLEEVATESE